MFLILALVGNISFKRLGYRTEKLVQVFKVLCLVLKPAPWPTRSFAPAAQSVVGVCQHSSINSR